MRFRIRLNKNDCITNSEYMFLNIISIGSLIYFSMMIYLVYKGVHTRDDLVFVIFNAIAIFINIQLIESYSKILYKIRQSRDKVIQDYYQALVDCDWDKGKKYLNSIKNKTIRKELAIELLNLVDDSTGQILRKEK